MNKEKERMLSGKLYQGNDEELVAERAEAKKKCFKINNISPEKSHEIMKNIKELFGEMGENASVKTPIMCDYGYNISLGENIFINHDCIFLDIGKIKIGKNVLIGPRVSFLAVSHPLFPSERETGYEYGTHIIVEDGVWIGGAVTINDGVTIGKNSVIGSGSVVVKDIPENVIAVGNPCRVLREIDEKDKMMEEFYLEEKC